MTRVADAFPWVSDRFCVVCEEQNGRYLVCDCPIRCHKSARVRFTVGDNGVLLFKCMKECPKLDMLRAVGASWKDCWPGGKMPDRVKQEIVARYNYRDENGKLLYQTIRLEPGQRGRDKDFRQRRPVAGSVPGIPRDWIYDLEGVRRVLFQLPEVLAAPVEQPVFVVAGEKDCVNFARVGLLGTTNVCGERAEWLDSYSDSLSGRDVVVIRDRDSAGSRHANEVCGSLMRTARSLRQLELPAKDATAFLTELRANDVTDPDELRAYVLGHVDAAPVWRAGA